MSDNADWNDENTSLVCELFAEEVRAQNRSGTHLNKTGYKNVMEKFKQRTGGLSYTKLQFKNKWDKIRTEYDNWKRLAKESGIGWDPAKNTYKATDDWWKNVCFIFSLLQVIVAFWCTCNIFFYVCSNIKELPSLKMDL